MQEKDAGHVRLINGMILPLDDKPILHNDPMKIQSISMKLKVKQNNSRIQSYYDVVKNHIKTKSKQEKIIIKYKPLKLLYEKDLDAEKDNKLLYF